MALLTCLYKLKQIENNMAELYHFIYQKLASQDEAAGDLFKSLSEEERIHEKEVDHMMNLYHEASEGFAERPGAGEELDRTLRLIENLKKTITDNIDELSPFDIARMAHDLESLMEARHQDYYAEVVDEGLKLLFQSLARGDRSHAEKIQTFINGRII